MGLRGGTQSRPLLMADVIDAALRVVERSSLDELTVRAVADECGVTPPAVHYHLRGGDDLARRVVEAAAARIDVDLDASLPWREQYLALVDAMDAVFARYPGTGVQALATYGPSAAAGRLTGTALGILRGAGFGDDEATELFSASYYLFAGWLATRDLARRGHVHPGLAAAGPAAPEPGTRPLHVALLRLFTPTSADPGAATQGEHA